MGKIIVAWPFHYTIDVNWFFRWVHMDKRNVVGSVAVDRVDLSESLKMLVEMALTNYANEEWDRLVIMEHDMLPPLDGFSRMAAHDPDLDIVGSMYFQHEPPHFPYVYQPIDDDGKFMPLHSWNDARHDQLGMISSNDVKRMVENPALYQCAAVGFGFTGISRRVLEKWDSDVPMFDFQKPWGSQDFWFCDKARDQGFNVWVDSGICCGHVTKLPVDFSYNQRYDSEHKPEIPEKEKDD